MYESLAITNNLILVVLALIVPCAIGLTYAQRHGFGVCISHPDGWLVRNSQDCSTYFYCYRGTATLIPCPPPQLFNADTSECVHPSRADCFECPSGGFIDIHVRNECNQFIRCIDYVPEQLTCGFGLIFDRELGMCNEGTQVSCPFEVWCPLFHDNLIFLPNPNNCKRYMSVCKLRHEFKLPCDLTFVFRRRYYTCINGILNGLECPDPLYFNLDRKMCDLAERTQCRLNSIES